MRYLYLLLIALINTAAHAQAESFYSGQWQVSTLASNLTTVISTGAALTPHVFVITSSGSAPTAKYTLTVDGTVIATPLVSNSSIVVQGKLVSITQIAPGSPTSAGTWKIIQQPAPAFEPVRVMYNTVVGGDQLVAALQTAQEFVLAITSSNGAGPGIIINILVDGVLVKDAAGNPVVFPIGSAIVGLGKNIALRCSGTTPAGAFVFGELRVSK